jgi:hypothetical protein
LSRSTSSGSTSLDSTSSGSTSPGGTSSGSTPSDTRSALRRVLVLGGLAVVSAAYVELALPKRQAMANAWVLVAHLIPFVFGTETIAALRPEWFTGRRWRELIQVGGFVAVFCYFVPKMFDRELAGDSDHFYYLMLTLVPFLILLFALQCRLGGGPPRTVRRAAYASMLIMLSGSEDAMFWILRHKPIPQHWTWASHINVVIGRVATRNEAFAFIAVHLMLAGLVIFLPDRFWSGLAARIVRPGDRKPPAEASAETPVEKLSSAV